MFKLPPVSIGKCLDLVKDTAVNPAVQNWALITAVSAGSILILAGLLGLPAISCHIPACFNPVNTLSQGGSIGLMSAGGAAGLGALLCYVAIQSVRCYLNTSKTREEEGNSLEVFFKEKTQSNDGYARYEPGPLPETPDPHFDLPPSGGVDLAWDENWPARVGSWSVIPGQTGAFSYADPGSGFGFALDGPPEGHDQLKQISSGFVASIKKELAQKDFKSFEEAESYVKAECLKLSHQIASTPNLSSLEKPTLSLALIIEVEGEKYLIAAEYGQSIFGWQDRRLHSAESDCPGVGTSLSINSDTCYLLPTIHRHLLHSNDKIAATSAKKRCGFTLII